MKRFLGVLLAGILVLGGLVGCARAEFEVTSLSITPSQILSGETVTVSAEIMNVGSADGVYTPTLTVNGTEVATKDIAVAAGATEQVSFTLTEETPGTYVVALNDLTGSFEVLKPLSAQEIVDGVIEALHEIDTYQYDMNTTINVAGVVDDEEGDITIDIDSSSTVDNMNRRMWKEMELAVHVTLPEEEEMVVGVEMYLIGNDAYILIEVEDETSPWEKERMPIGSWDEMAKVDTDVAILEEATVTLVGSEKINSIDCYVLEIIPNEERLLDAANQDTIAEEQFLPFMEDLIRELIEDASVKQWVEKDTFFLAKTEITMEGEVPPDVFGDEGEGMLTVNMSIVSLIFNYNKSFNIELPTEAEEAISWESDGYSEAAETELASVQTATYALMVDNEIATLPNPVIVATNDMSAFPDTSVCSIDKIQDTNGNLYVRGEDMNGYFLYQHDITGDGAQTGLVNYLASQYSMGTYTVDSSGTVTQVTTGYE